MTPERWQDVKEIFHLALEIDPAQREAEAMLERDEWLRWRFNLRLQAGQAEYWLAQGNPEQAKEYARRLLETASHYEARKYIAVAHKLLAEVAIARGDLTAERHNSTPRSINCVSFPRCSSPGESTLRLAACACN